MDESLKAALENIRKPCEFVPNSVKIKGPNFDNKLDLNTLLSGYASTGFQASNLHKAISVINEMLKIKKEQPVLKDEVTPSSYEKRPRSGCTIFLGYTSNLMSSGLREVFKYLTKHNCVDCIVTTAGGIEEDFIKCLDDFVLGEFTLSGSYLRSKGLNRIGNLLVPNSAYCSFQDWLMPVLDEMLIEQNKNGVSWTPSKFIDFLGKRINNENSVYYWASVNNIPVFCPALTDGSLGDILYFHSYVNPGLKLDIIEDQRFLNNLAVHANKAGIIVLGGGLAKHQICNASLMRNGAEYAVLVNTGIEYDGSDSGGSPEEAKSWGKLTAKSDCVKVFCDATIAFPLIVAKTFCEFIESNRL